MFYRVTPDPTLACIADGLKELLEFKPDVIIALGGGSPMDAAKVGHNRVHHRAACPPPPTHTNTLLVIWPCVSCDLV